VKLHTMIDLRGNILVVVHIDDGYDRRPIALSLADRVVLQMDQAAPADQKLFGTSEMGIMSPEPGERGQDETSNGSKGSEPVDRLDPAHSCAERQTAA
jgi:hypothetical protein